MSPTGEKARFRLGLVATCSGVLLALWLALTLWLAAEAPRRWALRSGTSLQEEPVYAGSNWEMQRRRSWWGEACSADFGLDRGYIVGPGHPPPPAFPSVCGRERILRLGAEAGKQAYVEQVAVGAPVPVWIHRRYLDLAGSRQWTVEHEIIWFNALGSVVCVGLTGSLIGGLLGRGLRFATGRYRRIHGRCVVCGYPRAGLASDSVCPECGAGGTGVASHT